MASKYLYDSVAPIRTFLSDPLSRPIPLVLASAAGSLGALFVWTKWRNRNRKLPPSPRGWPVLGNLLDLSDDNMHLDFMRLQERNNLPDIFTLSFGPWYRTIILNSFDAIKDVISNKSDLFSFRPPLLVMSTVDYKDDIFAKHYDDPTWREGKSLIMSALRSIGFGSGRSSEEKILEQIDVLIARLDSCERRQDEGVELSHLLEYATANVIFGVVFNKTYDYEDPEFNERIQKSKHWFWAVMGAFTLEILPSWIPKIFMRKQLKSLNVTVKDLRSFILEEIEAHKKTLDAENPRDFIEIYLTRKKGTVDVETLADTIVTMMPDAVETVGAYINWIMLYAVSHPSVMKKIQDEIERVTGGNRRVCLSDKPEMAYLEAVIMEVARVACPITFTSYHCPAKDCYFRGYFIPRNTPILCNLYAALRNPDAFVRPDEFIPERFLTDDGKVKNIDSFIPFGTGPRKCMGEQLSKAEMFLFTANLIQTYDISFAGENPELALGSHGGVIRPPQTQKLILKRRF